VGQVDRQRINHWDVLIPGSAEDAHGFLDELADRLEAGDVGAVSIITEGGGFFGGGKSQRLVRLARPNLEIDVTTKPMAGQIFVSWDAYYCSTALGRAWEVLRQTKLSAAEKAEAQAFASVSLNLTRDLATEIALAKGGRPPVAETDTSGVLEP
jgi:hypothetical protein